MQIHVEPLIPQNVGSFFSQIINKILRGNENSTQKIILIKQDFKKNRTTLKMSGSPVAVVTPCSRDQRSFY